MRTRLMIAVAAVVIGSGAVARDRTVPPVTPAGKPLDCVPLSQIRETRVRSDQIIDFYLNGGKVYRNTLPQSCPRLGFEERFLYKTSLNQLCSVDIITVLSAGGGLPGPTCGLGQFQPVTGAPR